MILLRIKTLKIQKFRGIIDEELDLDGKNLLLKGDNGTGKSSIVSAIDFFFTGEISPLKGVQGLSIKKHAPHVRYNPEDLNIEVEFKDGTCLNRNLKDEPNPPNHLKKFFNSAKEQKFILHRKEILSFILSQPAERYRAIGNILGIESLDKIELKLKRLRDDFQHNYDSLVINYKKIKSDLTESLKIEIRNTNDILIGINYQLKIKKLAPLKSIEEIKEYSKEKFENTIEKSKSSKKIVNIKEVMSIVENFNLNIDLVNTIKEINQIKKDLLNQNAQIQLKVKSMLENGYLVIKEAKNDRCPLCEQEIDYKILLKDIEKRLEVIKLLSNEHEDLTKKSNLLYNEIHNIEDNLKLIKSIIGEDDEFTKYKKESEKHLKALDDFSKKYADFDNYELKIDAKRFSEEIEKINHFLIDLNNNSKQLIYNFRLTEEESNIYDIINLLQQVEFKKNQMVEFEIKLNKIESLYKISDKLYMYFSDAKKEKINNVYQTLKEDIQQFYQSLHPGDPHKNVELKIDSDKRASTILKIDSFNRIGEDPRALTSEGHLDTLGVCIFLAFVKKFNEGCSLIILDDIVTTVDANHREKLAKLLLDEFSEFQMIITTHDGIWYQQLCSNQRTCGVEGKFKNLRIIGWDLDIGPRIIPYKPRWIKIQESLVNGDYEIGGMISRRYLEWILKEICGKMKAKIEYKRNSNYMMGELLDSAESRMKRLLRKLNNRDDFKVKIVQVFNDLRSNQFMGNLLAHDNPLIEQLSSSETINFCNRVNSLYEHFLCPNCKSFVSYNKEFNEIRCSNKACQKPFLKKV